VHTTLLYISSETVIPVPVFTGINASGNPIQKYWVPPYQVRGKLVKPGLTIKVEPHGHSLWHPTSRPSEGTSPV